MVDQYFGHQNYPMSQPPLDLTPLGTNITYGTTPPSDLIPVRKKYPNPTSPELPTDIPGDPYPSPSLSDKYNTSNDINSNKYKKIKRNEKKKCYNNKTDDS